MRLLAFAAVATSVVVGSAVACSASHDTPSAPDVTEAGDEDDAAPAVEASVDAGPDALYPATPFTLPQVVNSGGPTLKTARIVPVFFPNDTYQAAVTDFLPKYLVSPQWTEPTAEYGVTGAQVAPAVMAPALPPLTASSTQLEAWLASQLDGTHPVWGATDDATLAGTIFVFYVAPGPLEVPQYGSQSQDTICQQAGGWHTHMDPAPVDAGAPDAQAALDAGTDGGAGKAPSVPVLYAVVGECNWSDGVSVQDNVTQVTSHELAETFTDPFVVTNPAYMNLTDSYEDWSYLSGGMEIGDMCQVMPSDTFTPIGLGYSIQRLWSNKAAMAGRDPCQPTIPGEPPYFNAIPDTPDTFVDPGYGVMVPGVSIPTGGKRTIDVHLVSDGPTADWPVEALSTAELGPSFTLDKATGNNGTVLHLTIGVPTDYPAGSIVPFMVLSGATTGTIQHWWGAEVNVTK